MHFLNGNNEYRLLSKNLLLSSAKQKLLQKNVFFFLATVWSKQIKSTQNLGSDKFTTNKN